uniref:Uncharacterized protein n=1 Tax=Ovis aries TaxID=9940 RepID=A0AC11DAU3_SHEEP
MQLPLLLMAFLLPPGLGHLNHHHPGGHNIKQQERTQQAFGVRRAIRHPGYNPENFSNDIMLLQLERKAKQTAAMRQLRLPRAMACTKPGQTCSGAGWGKDSREGTCPHSLQEVKLTTQEDQMCEFYLHYYYTIATQLCTGDPKTKKASFKVRRTVHFAWIWGEVCLLKIWVLGTTSPSRHQDTSWG